MADYNNIVTAPVSATKVARLLQTSSVKVSHLCTHKNINKWAKYKPVCDNNPIALHDITHGKPISSGITLDGVAVSDPELMLGQHVRYRYQPPYPPYPFRLGDFQGYQHNAQAPCTIRSWDEIEKTGTGKTVALSFVEQLTAYNMSLQDLLSDIPDFNAEEWRIAVMMSDKNFDEGIRFWVSDYPFASTDSRKNDVTVNVNSLSLNDGDRMGCVVFLLKTGEDWEVNYQGHAMGELPIGNTEADYKAIALPVSDDNDHFVVTIKNNAVYSAMYVSVIEFRAICESSNQRDGAGKIYNKYSLEAGGGVKYPGLFIQIQISKTKDDYATTEALNQMWVKAELALQDYYDVSKDGSLPMLSDFKSSGSAVLADVKLGDFAVNDTEDFANIELPEKIYLYTTYSLSDTYDYALRIKTYLKGYGGDDAILKVETIPFKVDGTGVNFVKSYKQYNQ